MKQLLLRCGLILATSSALAQGDPSSGRSIFLGDRRLTNGGAACLACHTVSGVSDLGGGSLGKDLTTLHARLGEAGVKAMLDSLQFVVMREAYKGKPLTEQEKADLVAFFKQLSNEKEKPKWLYGGRLWGIGIYGAIALFALMLIGWRRQRTSLSERLRRRK